MLSQQLVLRIQGAVGVPKEEHTYVYINLHALLQDALIAALSTPLLCGPDLVGGGCKVKYTLLRMNTISWQLAWWPWRKGVKSHHPLPKSNSGAYFTIITKIPPQNSCVL